VKFSWKSLRFLGFLRCFIALRHAPARLHAPLAPYRDAALGKIFQYRQLLPILRGKYQRCKNCRSVDFFNTVQKYITDSCG